MNKTKSLLLASAALAIVAMTPASANAFDEVDWVWNKEVDVNEDIVIDIDDEFDLSGLVEIEKIQTNIGNVTAEATLNDFEHNPPGLGGEPGSVMIDQTFVFDTTYDDDLDPDNIAAAGPIPGEPDGVLQGTLVGGIVDEGDDVIGDLTFQVTGEVDLESIGGVNSALDLPKVENLATAVANNQSIDSTVALMLHDAQFNFGGFDPEAAEYPEVLALGFSDQSDNFHTDAAVALTIAGALGIITQGEVSATATVDDETQGPDGFSVVDAFVENAATAVGNNMSINLEAQPTVPGDAFMVADVGQWNYANVSATAYVDDVSISNYAGLGAAGFGIAGVGDDPITPLVSNVATAVGNNFSATISNIDVSVDP